MFYGFIMVSTGCCILCVFLFVTGIYTFPWLWVLLFMPFTIEFWMMVFMMDTDGSAYTSTTSRDGANMEQ